MRCVNVRVFPVPGPATMSSGPPGAEAATRWSASSRSSSPVPTSSIPASIGSNGSCGDGGGGIGTGFSFSGARRAVGARRGLGTTTGAATSNSASVSEIRSSSGSNSRMIPYSPSKPGVRLTCPARSRRIASPSSSPPTRVTSSSGTVRRIASSGPSAATSVLSFASTVFERGPTPLISPRIWLSCTRCTTSGASAGRWSSGRSARSSTRDSTPTVSGLPHSGQRPPASRVRAGAQFTPHARWPSAWYLPSSGKNSTVPARAAPLRRPSRMAK